MKHTGLNLMSMLLLILAGCSGGGSNAPSTTPTSTTRVITALPASETTPPSGGLTTTGNSSYVVFAWNDLGMHCLNPSYDTAVILPPYNTLRAQVIQRGNKPAVVTSGLTVSYRIIQNTTSQKGLFQQFWQYAQQLFGTTPQIDKGLNLDDPTVSNGLTGTMLAKTGYFIASGIPLTPLYDGGAGWNPFQLAEITVKDSGGTILAQTRTTIPTSDEINCAKCHAPNGTLTDTFNDILAKHDQMHGTSLQSNKPVLCASCHASPALGTPLQAGKPYLSQAIHHSHATRGAACYDCHPGPVTKCSRSVKHMAADGNCSTCHGDMATVASSVAGGTRTPWLNEPKCVTCHNTNNANSTGIAEVDTGTTLYRNATGHGGVFCTACHGSPHAMTPSTEASDNYQPMQYQGKAVVLGDCRVCHNTSLGGGSDFAGEHGTNGRSSSCNICHTGFQVASDTTKWPHQRQWKSR